MKRMLLVTIAAIVGALTLTGCFAPAPSGSGDLASQVNNARAQNGLGALYVSGELVNYATSWASQLDASGGYYHSCMCFSYGAAGEVLALGGDPVGQWLGSPEHRHIILAGWASAIGCATVGNVSACEVGG